jgi:hypothetical protein
VTDQRNNDRPLRKRVPTQGDAGRPPVHKGNAPPLSKGPEGIERDPTFGREIEAARAVMRRYRSALRKLAE